MLTLAIETSEKPGSVAIRKDGSLLAERVVEHKSQRHAQALVPEIKNLLEEFQIAADDVDLVAVSVGPGSFTGLRIGVVCAKTWAYSTGCALVGVCTLQSISQNSSPEIDDIHVIANAQRKELFWGFFHRSDSGLFEAKQEIRIISAENFCKERTEGELICGPGTDLVEKNLKVSCQLLPEQQWRSQASTVGWLGEKLFEQGHRDDPFLLEPFYLRKSAAEEKWDAKLNEK